MDMNVQYILPLLSMNTISHRIQKKYRKKRLFQSSNIKEPFYYYTIYIIVRTKHTWIRRHCNIMRKTVHEIRRKICK